MKTKSNDSKNAVTRRNFTKAGGAAGFAILTAAQGGAKAASSDNLKVGLLGCGNRGTGAARQILEGNANVTLVALADLFPDKIESRKKMYRELGASGQVKGSVDLPDEQCFTGWDAYQRILETDIDILIEGTLPYSRPKHIEAAVNAGKHIFCEKPVAADAAGIRQFMAAVKKHKQMGLSFVAGTQRRHQQEYVETLNRIHDGEIGDVVSLVAYWDGRLPFVHERKPEWGDVEYAVRNWYAHCWVAGDSIVEQHVHNIDVCNWAMGTHPVRVRASGGRNWKPNLPKYGDIYDHFACDFEYENGVHMHSHCRHWDGCPGKVSEEIIGTKGRSNGTDLGEKSEISPYVQEHIDLVDSITGEGSHYHEGMQIAESTMTAIMGRMAAYTGAVLTWEEALAAPSIVPEHLDLEMKLPVRPVPRPVEAKNIR